jgi:hypothetical protein
MRGHTGLCAMLCWLTALFPHEMKLIVINSAGPMGSTVLGALIEQFGYQNLPARKRGLHDYLMGERSVEDNHLRMRTRHLVESLATPRVGGGTSVIDRDRKMPIQRLDPRRIEDDLSTFDSKHFSSVADMYLESSQLLAKGMTYKPVWTKPRGWIEYTTDIEAFSDSASILYERYCREFGDVLFFHMHRDFVGWLDSLSSQLLLAKKLTPECARLRLSGARKRYDQYEQAVSAIPGIHINFESLFLPNTPRLVEELSNVLGSPEGADLEAANYDLYGSVTDYKSAFSRDDVTGKYLNGAAISFAKLAEGKPRLGFLDDLIFEVLYLFSLAKVLISRVFRNTNSGQ